MNKGNSAMATASKYHLEASNLHKSYSIGSKTIQVLNGVNLLIERGSWTALLGASGSGKTTLLNLIGLLEHPEQGKIFCNNVDYASINGKSAAAFRNRHIGFIFQAYHMLPELTILENVALPGMFGNIRYRSVYSRAEELLERVGLKDRMKHRPPELSGGEQQRAAIARALINSPGLILADEPTGNLDSVTGAGILEIFSELHRDKNAPTIIMITHDHQVAALSDIITTLRNGMIDSKCH
jgi:ABC-type lipoprotein export system ATPase subunit